MNKSDIPDLFQDNFPALAAKIEEFRVAVENGDEPSTGGLLIEVMLILMED